MKGASVTVIPDIDETFLITEIKNVQSLSYTKHMQGIVNAAQTRGVPVRVIVNMNTNVSGPMVDAVTKAGEQLLGLIVADEYSCHIHNNYEK